MLVNNLIKQLDSDWVRFGTSMAKSFFKLQYQHDTKIKIIIRGNEFGNVSSFVLIKEEEFKNDLKIILDLESLKINIDINKKLKFLIETEFMDTKFEFERFYNLKHIK